MDPKKQQNRRTITIFQGKINDFYFYRAILTDSEGIPNFSANHETTKQRPAVPRFRSIGLREIFVRVDPLLGPGLVMLRAVKKGQLSAWWYTYPSEKYEFVN